MVLQVKTNKAKTKTKIYNALSYPVLPLPITFCHEEKGKLYFKAGERGEQSD